MHHLIADGPLWPASHHAFHGQENGHRFVHASSRATAVGHSKEPKKKEEELEEEEPKKQEEKKKGEELITDVKEDPNETLRAPKIKVRINFFGFFLALYILSVRGLVCLHGKNERSFFSLDID